MATLNQTIGPYGNMKNKCSHFTSVLMLGIACLDYFELIKSTPRFVHFKTEFDMTASIIANEYMEDSVIRIYCPEKYGSDVFWFRGYNLDNMVQVKEIYPVQELIYRIENHDFIHYLVIKRAYLHLSGSYTCIYSSGEKYKDFTSRIKLNELPKICNFKKRIYGTENQAVVLKCTVPGAYDANIDIYWEKHHKPVENSTKYNVWRDGDHYFLEIYQLKKTDEGWYNCLFQHFPSRNERAVLYIRTLPQVKEETTIRTVFEGQDVNFECPAEFMRFSLLRKVEGPILNESTVAQYLATAHGIVRFTIPHVTPEDEGTYFCKISSKSTTNHTILIVLEKIPVLLTENIQLQAYSGMEKELKCKSTFRSFQEITWREKETFVLIAQGNELSYKHEEHFQLIVDEYSSTLLILSVGYKDKGNYTCALGDQVAEISLVIRDVPQINECMYAKFVPLGLDATFECRHPSALDLPINWLRNGQIIDTNSSKYMARNNEFSSYLTVRNVQNADTGNYTGCFDVNLSNCLQFSEINLELNVIEERNNLEYSEKFYMLTEGDQIKMSCSVYILHSNESLYWMLPDTSVIQCSNGSVTKEEYVINSTENECTLSIYKLMGDSSTKNHSGFYLCQLNNTSGNERYLVSYNLKVTSGPKFPSNNMTVTAFLGYGYKLSCNVSNPDQREVNLVKKINTEYQLLTFEVMQEGDIYQLSHYFHIVNENDAGTYLCKFFLSSRYGYKLGEMKITLKTAKKPVISLESTSELTVGERAILQCNISNFENYTQEYFIEWLKIDSNGFHLISSRNILVKGLHYYELSNQKHHSQLIIKHIFNMDYGQYMCRTTTEPAFFRQMTLNFEALYVEKEEKIFGIRGMNVELICRHSDGVKNISWFVKKGIYSISINDMKKSGDHLNAKYETSKAESFSKLIIKNAQFLDTATYRCLYPDLKIVDQDVKVVDEPNMIISNITVWKGHKATLSCSIENAGELEAFWTRNQHEVTGRENDYTLIKIKSFDRNSVTIEISSAKEKHQGNYTCFILGLNPPLIRTAQLTVLG